MEDNECNLPLVPTTKPRKPKSVVSKATEVYSHHGVDVVTRKVTKGKHRAYCLCYDCGKFVFDTPFAEGKPVEMLRQFNCQIANRIFDTCIDFNVVTPVFECPLYVKR